MKQASHIWNITFHKTMEELGFKHLANEWCIYHCCTPTSTMIFTMHIDNIITISSLPDKNNTFKAELKCH
jgi:hypothetical protein